MKIDAVAFLCVADSYAWEGVLFASSLAFCVNARIERSSPKSASFNSKINSWSTNRNSMNQRYILEWHLCACYLLQCARFVTRLKSPIFIKEFVFQLRSSLLRDSDDSVVIIDTNCKPALQYLTGKTEKPGRWVVCEGTWMKITACTNSQLHPAAVRYVCTRNSAVAQMVVCTFRSLKINTVFRVRVSLVSYVVFFSLWYGTFMYAVSHSLSLLSFSLPPLSSPSLSLTLSLSLSLVLSLHSLSGCYPCR